MIIFIAWPFLLALIYIGFRNSWVAKTRLRWIYARPKLEPDPWYVFGYNEMVFKYFWVWDSAWFERRGSHRGESQ